MNPNTLGTLRRLTLGAVCGATTLLAVAAPAGADAPTRIDAEYWGVSCVAGLGDGQTLFLFGSGTTDGTEGGVGAFVEAADGSQVAEGQASSFAFGSTFSTTMDLGGSTLVLQADVNRGASTTEQVNEHDGNAWTKGTTTFAELTVTPTSATYGGSAVDFSDGGCDGDINGFDVRTTNPAASIRSDRDFQSDICDVPGLPDAQVRVTGALPTTYVELVLDHGGDNVEKAQGDLVVKGRRGTLRTDVVNLFTGEVTTRATINLALERAGKSLREVVSEDGATNSVTVTPYRETITVALADGRKGETTCSGFAVTSRTRVSPVR